MSKHSGGRRSFGGGSDPEESTLATKQAGDAPFKGRRSKIDPFTHLVGNTPDQEVAALAGVSAENVRTWRRRRGIPATWPGASGSEPGVAAAAKTAAPKRSTKKRKKPNRRKSKLDPYRAHLGEKTDREVAEMADVTVENVRAYRKRHNIAASWQNAAKGTEPQATVAAEGPKAATAPKAPRGAATKVAPRTPPAPAATTSARSKGPARSWAFRVTASVGGVEKQYVTIGADVVEAAQNARDRLALQGEAFVEKIEVVGVAL